MSRIFGIGIDIVSNARIENALKRYQLQFLNKIFSQKEINVAYIKYKDAQMQARYFAKRFAGKEALIKALGVSISGVEKNRISILNTEYGMPYIDFTERNKKLIKNIIGSEFEIHISLSDEKEYSIANVIISV